MKRNQFWVRCFYLQTLSSIWWGDNNDDTAKNEDNQTQNESVIGDDLTNTGDRALNKINQAAWGMNKTIASFTLYTIKI
ncbi:hypothetical protein LCL90_22855 [Bacillus infantis]|uniref:hypothetical protein n=1 Tax=Bacillus infantis TaxID=324767 RepID=UPI001CD58F22|nr:hypothetical protein [Bacillus infantis]MCA1037474.1 hypothetical protein [Bacillus infantis]